MTKKITEADRRATKKYHTEKCSAVTVRFQKEQDADIIAFLNDQPCKIEAIRDAIRLYIKESKIAEEVSKNFC